MNWKQISQYNQQLRQVVRERWKTNELSIFLIEYEDALENATKSLLDTEQAKMVILRINVKSLITMREIIVLCEAGYPDGAFSLSRQLYEQMIHIRFIMAHRKDPDFSDYIEDYETNGRYQIYKYNKEMAKVFNEDESTDLQKEYDDLKKNSHHTFPDINKHNDYWWAGKKNFGELVKDVKSAYPQEEKILDKLHLFYTGTNRAIHANAAGNKQRLGGKTESHVIDTSQNFTGQGIPLYFSTLCMTVIMLCVCQIFDMDFNYYRQTINEFACFYGKESARSIILE